MAIHHASGADWRTCSAAAVGKKIGVDPAAVIVEKAHTDAFRLCTKVIYQLRPLPAGEIVEGAGRDELNTPEPLGPRP